MFQSIIKDEQLNAVKADYKLSLVMAEYVSAKAILYEMNNRRHHGVAASLLIEILNSIKLAKIFLKDVEGEIFKKELPPILDRMEKNTSEAINLNAELMEHSVKPRDATISSYKKMFNDLRIENFIRLKEMLLSSKTVPSTNDEKEVVLDIISSLIASLQPEITMH